MAIEYVAKTLTVLIFMDLASHCGRLTVPLGDCCVGRYWFGTAVRLGPRITPFFFVQRLPCKESTGESRGEDIIERLESGSEKSDESSEWSELTEGGG